MKINFTRFLKRTKIIKLFLLTSLVLVFSVPTYSQFFIEAENYSNMSGIKTQATSDVGGGLNLGWIDNGDWMEYSINIPLSGDYEISVRTASEIVGIISIASDDNLVGSINLSSTGGWQDWQTTASTSLFLNEGMQAIKLTNTSGGFNLNWIEIKLINSDDDVAPTTPVIGEHSADVHNILLGWAASTDIGSAIAGYKIYNEGALLAFTENTNYNLSKLAPGTDFNLMIYACDLAGNSSSAAELSVSTSTLDNWELVWFDEFDGTEVDTEKWYYETGGDGWGNGEAQYYTNGANSTVVDGELIIEARKESYSGNEFTSSRMNTKGNFLYNRIEVRAKLPKTNGTWPAIWTLPTDWIHGGWPDCGEIDIMEHSATNNYGDVFGTVHTGAYNHVIGTQKSGGTHFDDVTDTYHTYTIEWYPDHIDWYIDGMLVFTFENEYKTSAEWPYDTPHHLLLNVAIGGAMGGDINYNGEWPQQMIIDYVRVYDLKIGEGDVTAPSIPTGLEAGVDGATITLNWTPSSDDQYVDGYDIYNGDELIGSTSGTSFIISGLDPFIEYSFGIKAKDFGSNESEITYIVATTGDIVSYSVPGIVEAENYLVMDGVETEDCEDTGKGLNVGYISVGDWMEYSIDVQTAGVYYIATRVASESNAGLYQLVDEGETVLTTVATPSTGGWQNWKTVVSDGFNLDVGVQKITIKSLADDFNINWIDITDDNAKYLPTTSIEEVANQEFRLYPNPMSGNSLKIELFNNKLQTNVCIKSIDGKEMYNKLFSNSKNVISIDNINIDAGIYIVSITSGNTTKSYKLIAK